MSGNRKTSVFGIIIGIIWGFSILLFTIGFIEGKKEPTENEEDVIVSEYTIEPEAMLDALDRKEYVQYVRYTIYSKEDGYTENTSDIYRKLFAVSDYINSVIFKQVYIAEGDAEMVEYYDKIGEEAANKFDNLYFVYDEINNKLLKH